MKNRPSHDSFYERLIITSVIAWGLAVFRVKVDTLWSRNATYRIIGKSYLYAGHYIPSTNTKVTNISGYQITPLVESTDSGDLLIDGDPQTIVLPTVIGVMAVSGSL